MKPTNKDTNDIDSPSHYTVGGIEPIEILKRKLTPEQYEGYLIGSAIVYLLRANFKDDFIKDCQKANWYTEKLSKLKD